MSLVCNELKASFPAQLGEDQVEHAWGEDAPVLRTEHTLHHCTLQETPRPWPVMQRVCLRSLPMLINADDAPATLPILQPYDYSITLPP
jgi:hypothetical protein